MSMSRAEATTPVASYLPIGVHDTPLPMGKYYPSNYENRNRGTVRHSSTTSSIQSTHKELDVKARLQQYQRDMITQTKMAAKDILGNNAQRSNSSSAPPSLGPFFLGATGIHLSSAFTTPISPRLNPLGSPGPVTPMNLEEVGGDYLSKGQPVLGVDPAGASRLEQQRGRWA